MFCSKCGKEISDGTVFCPECGAAQQGAVQNEPQTMPQNMQGGFYGYGANQPVAKREPYNMMCILGLVISGISTLLDFWGIVGIAGTVVSVIGLISCTRKNERGKVLAIIGIVIGAFSILYRVVLLVLVMANMYM